MTDPVLMAVDGNPDSRTTLDGTLRRRYEHDYLVISEASSGTALGRLRELRAADCPVAVVMAAAEMTEAPAGCAVRRGRAGLPGAVRLVPGTGQP